MYFSYFEQKYCVYEEVTSQQNFTEKFNVSMLVNGVEQYKVIDVVQEKNVTTKIPVEKCKYYSV